MSQLFLASSIADSGGHIAKKISLQGETLKAAFIYTGGEVEKDKSWIDDDRNGLNQNGIKTFDYTITGKTAADFEKDLGDCDLIHINGGDTMYLLYQMKRTGFDKFIKAKIQQGVIYTGSSAGSEVIGPDIEIFWKNETKEYRNKLKGNFIALGVVDLMIFPHWGNPLFKDLYLEHRVKLAYQKGKKIILLNDDQYVEVIDGNYKIVDITSPARNGRGNAWP